MCCNNNIQTNLHYYGNTAYLCTAVYQFSVFNITDLDYDILITGTIHYFNAQVYLVNLYIIIQSLSHI